MSGENISEIIHRFKQGEKEAFNEILKNYRNSLVNFVFKFTGQRDLAEDMAQEIFLKVYQQLPRYKEQGKFSSWLFRLATNFCLNEIKRTKRRPQVSLDGQNENGEQYLQQRLADPSQEPPDQLLEKQELIKQVQQALLSLPQTQRIALILSQYENLSYQEIAAVLNTSVSAVEALIFRAKQSLRKKLL